MERGVEAALELEEMLLTRRPEELFAAEDESDCANGAIRLALQVSRRPEFER